MAGKVSRELAVGRRLEEWGREALSGGTETLQVEVCLPAAEFASASARQNVLEALTLSGLSGGRSSSMTVCWYTSNWDRGEGGAVSNMQQ